MEVKRKGLTVVNGPTTGRVLSSRTCSSLSCLVACPVLQSWRSTYSRAIFSLPARLYGIENFVRGVV